MKMHFEIMRLSTRNTKLVRALAVALICGTYAPALAVTSPILKAVPTVCKSCVDLGTLGGRFTLGMDMNSRGQIVGSSKKSVGDTAAFIYSEGHMSLVPALNRYSDCTPIGINETGSICGNYLDDTAPEQAFVLDGSHITSISDPRAIDVMTMAINRRSQVVGSVETTDGRYLAFIWSTGGMQIFQPFGSESSEFTGINNAGVAVGDAEINGVDHALELTLKSAVDVGALLGNRRSWGLAINNKGVLLGNILNPHGGSHPFLYRNGKLLEINAPPDFDGAFAYGINDSNEIVGKLSTHDHKYRAFYWKNGVYRILLDKDGEELQIARRINNSGAILCWGRRPHGWTHAFIVHI